MSHLERCDSCGQCLPPEQLISFEEQNLCQDCFRSATLLCARCGERIWRDENAGDDETPLCQSCYDHYYLNCADCGRVIHEGSACYLEDDDSTPLCSHCYTRATRNRAIHDYYYKPDPIFYGSGPRYFGVELEIDGAGEDDASAQTLLRIANRREELLYCKHDGSLEEGFELVTHPMTLDCPKLYPIKWT